MSQFSRRRDWQHAHNYVAKRYMENVERGVYFEDVRLQMDAKLWGEEYNRHRPPKKVGASICGNKNHHFHVSVLQTLQNSLTYSY